MHLDTPAALRLPFDDAGARREREILFAACAAQGDATGCAATAAAALIAIASRHADFRGLGSWLARFAAAVPGADAPLVLRLFIDVAHACRPAIDSRVPFSDPAVAVHAQAAFEALRGDLPVSADERLVLGRVLLDQHTLNEDRERFNAVASLLHGAVQDAAANPYWVGAWWWRLATANANWGDEAAAATSRERAWAVARGAGVVDLDYALTAEDLLDLLRREQLGSAAKTIAAMNALSPDVHATWRAHGNTYEARYHLMRNAPGSARELCATALRIYAENELPERERDMCRSVLAQAHLLLGEEALSIEILQDIASRQSGGQLATAHCLIAGTRAALALRLNAPEAGEALAAALAAARSINWYAFFFSLPTVAATLFEAALARDIERGFVVKAIRMRGLAAPDPGDAGWPWRLRVRALGGFAIEREDEALRFEGKAQKKPLDLLKALIAAGGDADIHSLIDQLWSDVEAKDPRAAFEMTLSRLRKLLDVDGAIGTTDGRLQINRRLVWCDTLAFDMRSDQLRAALQEHSGPPAVLAAVRRTLALYGGPLLGNDSVAAWALAPRERLATRFRRAVAEGGAWFESRSCWREAVEIYEQGLAQDALAEPLYRGLMRCHLALGEATQALLAYRRCRDLLARVLQVAPGADTEALHRQVRGG